jgi:hypothetical protein
VRPSERQSFLVDHPSALLGALKFQHSSSARLTPHTDAANWGGGTTGAGPFDDGFSAPAGDGFGASIDDGFGTSGGDGLGDDGFGASGENGFGANDGYTGEGSGCRNCVGARSPNDIVH